MLMRLILIVFVLGSNVSGQNETEFDFIKALPQNQRTDILEKIGRRISDEVRVNDKKDAPVVEISKAQMEQFNDFVKNILSQEKTNLRKNANFTDEMERTTLNKDEFQESDTNIPKKQAENSKIINIPLKYDDIFIQQLKNKTQVNETNILKKTEKQTSDNLDENETSKSSKQMSDQQAAAYFLDKNGRTDNVQTNENIKQENQKLFSDAAEINTAMPLETDELSANTQESSLIKMEIGQVNKSDTIKTSVDSNESSSKVSTTKTTTTRESDKYLADSNQNIVQTVLTSTTSKWIDANEIPTTVKPEITSDLTTLLTNAQITNLVQKNADVEVFNKQHAIETKSEESSKRHIGGQEYTTSTSYFSNMLPMALMLNAPVPMVAPANAIEAPSPKLEIPFAIIPPLNVDKRHNRVSTNLNHNSNNDMVSYLSQVTGNMNGKEILPHKNAVRCRYGRKGGSSESNDCSSTEEEYDDYNPVASDIKEKETVNNELEESPKKISALVVFLSSKNEVNNVEDFMTSYSNNLQKKKLKDPSIDIYQTENDVFEKDALADIIDQQMKSHVSKKDKFKKDCPKQHNVDMYVDAMKLIIVNNDESLQNYDWLGTTVDIQAALQKLLNLSSKVLNDENIHSADYQLLQFVMYLKKIAEQTKEERDACNAENAKPTDTDQNKKLQMKTNWDIKVPKFEKRGQGNVTSLYAYYNNADGQNKDDVADFVSFLNVLQTGMYDLHTVITSIAEVTKYNKQSWFEDIKNLYLNYSNNQDILGILLHLTLTRIIGSIEASAKNGLTYNHIQYIVDHQQEILKIADEFDFCSVLINEMEKNIYVD